MIDNLAFWNRKRPDTLKGLAAGLIGGLVASWVMNQFQAGLAKLSQNKQQNESQSSGQSGNAVGQQQSAQGGEPANVKAAAAVSEQVFGHELQTEEKQPAGTAVHYIYGTCIGGLYGIAAEHSEHTRAAAGTIFGSALWAGSDEIAVPAFHLSKMPQEYPVKTHISALASHVVYGVTTELVRRALRAGPLA